MYLQYFGLCIWTPLTHHAGRSPVPMDFTVETHKLYEIRSGADLAE